MYLAQHVDAVRKKGYWEGHRITRYVVTILKVVLKDGVPFWAVHRNAGDSAEFASDAKKWYGQKGVPWMQDAGHGKRVTMSQAQRLTGIDHKLAALDYLTEKLQEGETSVVQNHQAPPRPKKAKPEPEPAPVATPVTRNATKLERANAKVAEWDAAVKHAQQKLVEWRRKAKRLARRAQQLATA